MFPDRVTLAKRWLVAAAFLLPLYFGWVTDHLWEDFFITFRVSQNLVHGHGMVFQPGERVHTFTSPLGMLVPALCSWVSGGHNDFAAIWLFRIVCCGFLAATMGLLLRVLKHLDVGLAGAVVAIGLFLFDGSIADFTIDGMETAMVLFFFVWTILALIEEKRRVLKLAIGVAGLLWSRPDGFIFAGAVLAGFALFVWWRQPAAERRQTAGSLIAGLVVGGVLYAPWFITAWIYFGSPIPNTIIAKSAALGGGASGAIYFPALLVAGEAWVTKIFMPPNYIFGGWSHALFGYSALLTIPASLYFVWPRVRPLVRALSFSFFIGGAYLETIPQFPWYYPWWQVLAILVSAAIVDDFVSFCTRLQASEPATGRAYLWGIRTVVSLMLVVHVALWSCTAVEMHLNQEEVEKGVRQPIGEWLHQHAKTNDSVLLEPLGYIGYYSQLKMLDWPGLSAPEVTQAIRDGVKTWPALIERFQPDWVVLRPREVRLVLAADESKFRREYQFAVAMDARQRIEAHAFYPGRPFALYDAVYMVYHRTAPRTAEIASQTVSAQERKTAGLP